MVELTKFKLGHKTKRVGSNMYISFEKMTDTKARVLSVFFTEPEQTDENTIIIEDVDIPIPQQIPDMAAHLRIDLENNEFYYDYIAPVTTENKVAALQQENTELKQAIADLTMTLAAVMAG